MSIKSVGCVPVLPKHRLTCHCGAVVIELDLPDGIVDPRRCDCSICSRLEGINPFLLGEVPVNDVVNHPADRAAPGTA